MADWPRIKAGIFAGESGGDYDALFGFSNRPGGQFSNVKLTNMTVDDAIKFSDPKGPYARWVKGQIGRVATPMGGFQVVGTTLRGVKKNMGLSGSEQLTPEMQDLIGQQILKEQGTNAWEGYKGPREPGSVPMPTGGPRTAYKRTGDEVQLASLGDGVSFMPAKKEKKPESRMSKVSGALADASRVFGGSGGGAMLSPAPQLFPVTPPSLPTPLFVPAEPVSVTKVPEVPVLTPPGQEPNLASALSRNPYEGVVPAGRDFTEGANPSPLADAFSKIGTVLAPDPSKHSFGYNVMADWIRDFGRGDSWYPGKSKEGWLKDWATDTFWTPEIEAGGTIKDTTPAPVIPDDVIFGGGGGVVEKDGGTTSSVSTGGPGAGRSGFSTIDAGTTFIPKEPPKIEFGAPGGPVLFPPPPVPGEVPDRPPIADIDFGPYLERMEEYRPEDLDRKEYMRERLLGNLSRALAAGAGGSGWSGWGGALARAGSGFGLAQADTTDAFLTEQAELDEAQRQWGMGQINLEMELEQRAQDIKNKNADILYGNELAEQQQTEKYNLDKYNVDVKNVQMANEANIANAASFYEWQNQVGALTQDSVADITDKELILKKVDPEGKTTFEVHKFNDPYGGMLDKTYLDTIKSVSEQFPNSTLEYQLKYQPFFQRKDRWGVQAVMAEEMINNGALAQMLPEYPELEQQADDLLEKQGVFPGATDYDQKRIGILTTLAAPHINIGDPGFLQQAAQLRTLGALLILGQPGVKEATEPGTP